MKKITLSIIILLLINVKASSHVEHYANFNYLEYELYRNNNSIGYHKYEFKREGENLSILSEVSFKITKLGVDLYKYFAKSEEVYEKGIFKSYSSKTRQNKKDRYVNIINNIQDKSLEIDGSSYKGKADKEYIVGTWWNHEIVKAKAQISGISGRIIDQTVTFIGKEKIKIEIKLIKHYILILNLQIKVFLIVKNLILIFGTKKILTYGLKQLSKKQVIGSID